MLKEPASGQVLPAVTAGGLYFGVDAESVLAVG